VFSATQDAASLKIQCESGVQRGTKLCNDDPPLPLVFLQDWGAELFGALKAAGGRAYSNYAVGYNNVGVPEATKVGIPVGNTPGACLRRQCKSKARGSCTVDDKRSKGCCRTAACNLDSALPFYVMLALCTTLTPCRRAD
jgi:hypothetical protein